MSLRRILPHREVNDHDVFVDVGSGMGRVVLQAARYSFRKVIGVEISETLHGIAWENIDRNRQRLRCGDIELYPHVRGR
jgi:tRNA G46 methylase TrmB